MKIRIIDFFHESIQSINLSLRCASSEEHLTIKQASDCDVDFLFLYSKKSHYIVKEGKIDEKIWYAGFTQEVAEQLGAIKIKTILLV